jgi:hypothetical protein
MQWVVLIATIDFNPEGVELLFTSYINYAFCSTPSGLKRLNHSYHGLHAIAVQPVAIHVEPLQGSNQTPNGVQYK